MILPVLLLFGATSTATPTKAELDYAFNYLALCPSRAAAELDVDLFELDVRLTKHTGVSPCAGMQQAPSSWNELFTRAGRPELVQAPPQAWELPASYFLAGTGLSAFASGGILALVTGSRGGEVSKDYVAPGLIGAGVGLALMVVAARVYPEARRLPEEKDRSELLVSANRALLGELALEHPPLAPAPAYTATIAFTQTTTVVFARTSTSGQLGVLELVGRDVQRHLLHVVRYEGFTPMHSTERGMSGGQYVSQLGVFRGREQRPLDWADYYRLIGKPDQIGPDQARRTAFYATVIGSALVASVGFGTMTFGAVTEPQDDAALIGGSIAAFAGLAGAVAFATVFGELDRQAELDADVSEYNRRVVEQELAARMGAKSE